MIQIAITLGPNCKKSAHNWATMQQSETWGAKMQSWKVFHACKQIFDDQKLPFASVILLRTLQLIGKPEKRATV